VEERRYSLLIDGQPLTGHGEIEVINPATERVLARAPRASPQRLDQAVDAARRAFPGWRALPDAARRAAVRQLGACLRANAEELSLLLTLEQGKPLVSARVEIAVAALWCDGMADLETRVHVSENSAARRSETRRVPLGVVAGIVPWNFPVGLAFWKIAPALITGNTMVLKPAPTTPLTTLRIGELVKDILPRGVLNILSGDDSLGPLLTAHPGIAKISFTGSTAVGREVMRTAAAHLKRVTLELGGNDAAIVMPDIDVEASARALFWAAFRNSGQFCVATKRMYVHDAIFDSFARALTELAHSIPMGHGTDPRNELGPIQNLRQFDRLTGLIERSRAANLHFLSGLTPAPRPGYFIPVTLLDNPPDSAEVVTEEAFGPVLPLLRFTCIDEVIERANRTDYGLAGSVWSSNLEQAARIASQLECGTVWVNDIHYMTPWAAFAGHKQSGFGVENGVDGLEQYTAAQTVVLRRNTLA
jgi:acyl-CoA reductase-like NAD-dependent aldehyde dehydrogenase